MLWVGMEISCCLLLFDLGVVFRIGFIYVYVFVDQFDDVVIGVDFIVFWLGVVGVILKVSGLIVLVIDGLGQGIEYCCFGISIGWVVMVCDLLDDQM